MSIFLPAVFTALSVYILCCYLGVRTAAGYHVVLDVGLSVSLAVLYAGTFSGTVTAFMAGLVLSGLFIATRHLVGYRKFTRRGWVTYPPTVDFRRFFEAPKTPR